MHYVVDTHAILWFLQGSRIGRRAYRALASPQSALVVPTIVLAEIKFLKARGRIRPSLGEVLTAIERDPRFTVYPFDESVVDRMPTELEMHDAIIVGTALVYQEVQASGVRIITRDPAIVEFGAVGTVW